MFLPLRSSTQFGLGCSFWSARHALTAVRPQSSAPQTTTAIVRSKAQEQFDSVPREERTKESFLYAIALFKERRSRNYVEFVEAACKNVKEYGVAKDLDVYKTLLDLFPKGKLIPQNVFQRIMLHYPKQQHCCVKLLDTMEWHGVCPDKEMHDMVVNVFGEWNFATKKIKRQLYWMPKLRHANPYLDRRDVEHKDLSAAQLAGIALRMMARDPATVIDYFKDSATFLAGDKMNWLVSAQSPTQIRLLGQLPPDSEVFVDGPFTVWTTDKVVTYATLTAAPNPNVSRDADVASGWDEDWTEWASNWEIGKVEPVRSMHEQIDSTILALGAFSPMDNTGAAHWLKLLEQSNPNLERLQVRFRVASIDPLRVHQNAGASHRESSQKRGTAV